MDSNSLMIKLFRFSEWILRLTLSNFLWLVLNLPIVYLTANLFFVTTSDQLLVNAITIALLAPFIFFPATSALFGLVRKWSQGELDVKIVRTFFKNYKENYLRSMVGGLVIVPLWLVLIFDFIYFSKLHSPLFYLFIAVGLFMFAFTINFFCNTVHFHLKFFVSLKNAFLLSIGRPIHTIGIALVNIIVFYISINVFTYLIILGMGAIAASLSFFIYYRNLPAATTESI
jgi:uncharacterized membrane protein YesL